MKKLKRIGVLTSGGDAPGMNAAIRAVVRTAIYNGLEVYGIRRGFAGMIEGDFCRLETTDVSNIIQRGGTMLKTARSEEFKTKEGRIAAYENLKKEAIEGLVVIGGDGSFKGAQQFCTEYPVAVMGIPGTIDNDIKGTDYTLGFDTAVNTAVEAIDKIRDTASAHDRIFIVEVMGRDAGYIALYSGISCGAEDILIPETVTNVEQVLQHISIDKGRKKLMRIIVVAEGDDFGGAQTLETFIRQRFPNLEVRSSILGHIQRGGSPTCFDRMQASRLGYAAVMALLEGKTGLMLGLREWQIRYTPFDAAIKQNTMIQDELLAIAKVLSL